MEPYNPNTALKSGLGEAAGDYELEQELQILRRDGTLIRDKARMLMEFFGMPFFARVLSDPEIGASTKLDTIRVLMELGDLKPKQAQAGVVSATGLSISINLPPGFVPQPKPSEQATVVIDMPPTPPDPLLISEEPPEPDTPPPMNVPDFKLGAVNAP